MSKEYKEIAEILQKYSRDESITVNSFHSMRNIWKMHYEELASLYTNVQSFRKSLDEKSDLFNKVLEFENYLLNTFNNEKLRRNEITLGIEKLLREIKNEN